MADNMELWLQETRGIERDPAEPMFTLANLERLFEPSRRYTRLAHVPKKAIFTLVDPNGAGLSNYSVVSFVEAEGYEVVRGVCVTKLWLMMLRVMAWWTARTSSAMVHCHMSHAGPYCLITWPVTTCCVTGNGAGAE